MELKKIDGRFWKEEKEGDSILKKTITIDDLVQILLAKRVIRERDIERHADG